MDPEGNSPSTRSNSETGASQPANSSNNGAEGGIPARRPVKTKSRKKRGIWKEIWATIKRIRTEVWVAIIGAIATIITTIIVALPAIIPLFPHFQLSPIPTFTSTAITAFITDSPTATPTFTSTPTILPSPTATDTPTASLTPIVTIESTRTTSVFVRLVANRNTGRPPLNVRFDARDSYLLEPDGRQLSCRGGPCFYTWSIYSGGQQIGNAENNSIGTFEHSFGSNGTYTVTVFVCRGRDRIDCAGSGTQIVVSR